MHFRCMVLISIAGIILCGCNNNTTKVDDKIKSITSNVTLPVQQHREITCPESWQKKVSIYIGKESSIKELLTQLADVCGIHLNMEHIADKSGIIYSGIDLPFFIVLKNICRLVKWRMQINSFGDITILNDDPYFHSHEVAFLTNRGSMSVNNNQSIADHVANLKSSSDVDLWKEVESNIAFLLNSNTVKHSINKQAGLLIVYATQAEHEQIASFLYDLHMRVASQVLIEAHIVSVSCGNEKPNHFGFNIGNFMKQSNTAQDANILIADNFVAAINFVYNMGPVTLIHSPTTMTMNNVPAMLFSWKKLVTYKITNRKYRHNKVITDQNKKTAKVLNILGDNDRSDTEFTSEPEFNNTGIALLVQPSIIDDHTVSIYVKPHLSWVVDKVQDPIISIMGGNVRSEMPVLEEQSIETTISLIDGQTAIIGGLNIENESYGSFRFTNSRLGFDLPEHFKKKVMILISCKIIKPNLKRIKSLSDFSIMSHDFERNVNIKMQK